MQNSDDLDRKLNEALASYCAVEPGLGLEARVLRRVHARLGRWGWLVLIPVLGALILAVAHEFPAVPVPMARPVAIAHVLNSFEVPASESEAGRAPVKKPRVRSKLTELPRRNVFPTPTPLTPEEEALVSFVWKHPKEAETSNMQAEIQPIEIPELRIAPLKISGE